jgi:hypothetical protein
MTRDHQDRRSIPDEKQKVMTDIIQVKLCPEDRRLARYSQGQSKLHFFLIFTVTELF